MNMFCKCIIIFQVSLNIDPVEEILKIRCHVYILMKNLYIILYFKNNILYFIILYFIFQEQSKRNG